MGFDETTLDGQSCMNQWCLIRTGRERLSAQVSSILSLLHFCDDVFVVLVSRQDRQHCHRGVFRNSSMLHSSRNGGTRTKNVGERAGCPSLCPSLVAFF